MSKQEKNKRKSTRKWRCLKYGKDTHTYTHIQASYSLLHTPTSIHTHRVTDAHTELHICTHSHKAHIHTHSLRITHMNILTKAHIHTLARQ